MGVGLGAGDTLRGRDAVCTRQASGRNQMARSERIMKERRREGCFEGEALCNRVGRVGDNPQGQGRQHRGAVSALGLLG